MSKNNYQIRHAGGHYWLLDMDQDGLNYKAPPAMNESGMYIYRRLEENKSVEEIIDDMCNDFKICKEEAAVDVDEFIRQMVKKGIIREG